MRQSEEEDNYNSKYAAEEYYGHEDNGENSYEQDQNEEDLHVSEHEKSEKVFFIVSSQISFTCRMCETEFPSNNKLHRHVKKCRMTLIREKRFEKVQNKIANVLHAFTTAAKGMKIVIFKTKFNIISEFSFRS